MQAANMNPDQVQGSVILKARLTHTLYHPSEAVFSFAGVTMPADRELRWKVKTHQKSCHYTCVVPGHTNHPRTSFKVFVSFGNKACSRFPRKGWVLCLPAYFPVSILKAGYCCWEHSLVWITSFSAGSRVTYGQKCFLNQETQGHINSSRPNTSTVATHRNHRVGYTWPNDYEKYILSTIICSKDKEIAEIMGSDC